MIKKLFSSQLRINMASGVGCSVINAATLMVGYPVFLHFLGFEKYGVWIAISTVMSFAQAATATKDEVLADLVDSMKDDIRYAENTVDFDDEKLKLIGWAGRKTATALAIPGQARLLEAPKQGEGWVFLDWKAPTDGGNPSAYKVMRRERPAGLWEDVATAVITEATLVEQPRGKELEYRIVAVNKTGDGPPSNTAMVVL